MNKKKKILLSLSALVVALALIVSGTFAFFIVYETTNDNAKVGEVSLKVSPLTVGHNKTYEIIDGKDSAKVLAECVESDTVVNAIIGFAGLVPTLSAIEAFMFICPSSETVYEGI